MSKRSVISRANVEVPTPNVEEGKIVITIWEWKEYQNLLKERDNTVISIQTQMKMQQMQAQALAKACKAGFMETGGIDGVTVINAKEAMQALKLADDVLA